MPEPLSPDETRSPFLLIFLVIAAVAAAIGIAVHFFPATTVDITQIHTSLLPETAVFKSDSILNAVVETTHTLFIASTVRIDNRLKIPIYLDDFSLTFTDGSGAQLSAKAYTKPDLASVQPTYPALTPLLAAPLHRETSIEPGNSAQGVILFALNIPQSTWDQRKSAVIQVDLYHRPSLYVTIPKP